MSTAATSFAQLRPHNYWDRSSRHGQMLDNSQYHDLRADQSINGRPLAAVLPPGTWGATGTIVKASTIDGAPEGYDPNGVAIEVIVDPDVPGQGYVLNMAQIQKEAMEQVMAQDATRPKSIEEMRFKASNIFRQFAVGPYTASPIANMPKPREAPLPLPGMYVCPQASEGGGQLPMSQAQAPQAPQQVQTARPASFQTQQPPGPQFSQPPQQQPMSVPPQFQQPPQQGWPQQPFQQPMQQQPTFQMPQEQWQPGHMVPPYQVPPPPYAQTAPQMAPAAPQMPSFPKQASQDQQGSSLFAQPMVQAQPQRPAAPQHQFAAPQITPPKVKVIFEMAGSPIQYEGYYHRVERKNAALVLVFDNRAVGYPRVFPQAQLDQDIRLRIVGEPVIYQVAVPNIRFELEDLGLEFYVLLIKNEIPYNQA